MIEETRPMSRHTIHLDRREKLNITGVLDVISFDEEAIITETEPGILVVRGQNLHVTRLNVDKGELDVEGEILSMVYEDAGHTTKAKSSMFGRLFR